MSDGILTAVLVNQEIEKLTQTTKELSGQNSILQNRLFWLTIATTILALIQTGLIILQIYLNVYK